MNKVQTQNEREEMERINLTIHKDLGEEFRRAVAEYIGFKKGNLQVAVEEAIRLWIKQKGKK